MPPSYRMLGQLPPFLGPGLWLENGVQQDGIEAEKGKIRINHAIPHSVCAWEVLCKDIRFQAFSQ